MTTKTVQITGATIGVIFVTALGGYFYRDTVDNPEVSPSPAPSTIQLEIMDTCKPLEQLRIRPATKLEYYQEPAWTYNDLITEMRIEADKGQTGSEKYNELASTTQQVYEALQQLDTECPDGRISDEQFLPVPDDLPLP